MSMSDESRSTWPIYDTIAMPQGSIERRMCEERKIEPVHRLRKCPTCGAKEKMENGRLQVEHCDPERHATITTTEPIIPRRTGDGGEEATISGPSALRQAMRLLREAND